MANQLLLKITGNLRHQMGFCIAMSAHQAPASPGCTGHRTEKDTSCILPPWFLFLSSFFLMLHGKINFGSCCSQTAIALWEKEMILLLTENLKKHLYDITYAEIFLLRIQVFSNHWVCSPLCLAVIKRAAFCGLPLQAWSFLQYAE